MRHRSRRVSDEFIYSLLRETFDTDADAVEREPPPPARRFRWRAFGRERVAIGAILLIGWPLIWLLIPGQWVNWFGADRGMVAWFVYVWLVVISLQLIDRAR